MNNWFSWAKFRSSLPTLFTGIILGILIVFFVRPSYHSIDTLSMLEATLGIVITALAIIGAFAVVITWNSIEDGVKKGVREYDEKSDRVAKELDQKMEIATNDLNEKVRNISEELDDIKQMVDYVKQEIEPSYMAVMQQHQHNKMVNDGNRAQEE